MSTSFFSFECQQQLSTAAQGYLPPIAGYTHHESDFSLQAPQRVLSLQLQDKVLLLTLQERPSCKTGYEIIYYVRTMNICIIELQKRKKLAPTNFLTQKISTKTRDLRHFEIRDKIAF